MISQLDFIHLVIDDRDFSDDIARHIAGIVGTSRGMPAYPEILQSAGIWYRLAGKLELSDEHFEKAYDEASDTALGGDIARDWAMTAIEQRNFPRALELLDDSENILRRLGGSPEKIGATVGFRGCALAAQGDMPAALRALLAADEILYKGSDPVYERNNLVHLLPLLPVGKRWPYAVRAVKLAVRTGSMRSFLATLAGVAGIRLKK